MKKYSRVYETVNLDAIRHNMEAMRDNLPEGTGMIGVVKADGYGLGAVPVALAIEPYVWGYAVAIADEGVILRRHGVKKPILILGRAMEEEYEDIIRYDLRPSIFDYEKARRLSELAAEAGRQAVIHIALDTGMSRIGYQVSEEAADEVGKITALPSLTVEGLFTHFARADERDKEATKTQLEQYGRFSAMLKDRGVSIPILHCANSAAILEMKQAGCYSEAEVTDLGPIHMTRAGISMYGYYPSDEVEKEPVRLEPAMELKTVISYVKEIGAGTPVSYGGTFTAEHRMKVATIPVGYADGYPRSLSGRADVLIHGCRARILGRVCMDQFMVDVTGIKGVKEGDEVTLIGRSGEEFISLEELAERGGGYHYEILCDISKRVPRVYMEDGKVIGSKDFTGDTFDEKLCEAIR